MITGKDGREYVLSPKVATAQMNVAGATKKNEHTITKSPYRAGVPDIYDAMLSAAPPYEPSDEVVERCMQAGLAAYDPFKTHSQQVAAIVRATIRAFIGGE